MDLDLDLEKYLIEYPNVSKVEVERFRDCAFSEFGFKNAVRALHSEREALKVYGRPALQPGPLVQVLSVSVHPEKEKDEPLGIYGRIYVEFVDSVYGGVASHDIYNRDRSLVETLDTTSALTLCGPDYSCNSKHAFIPMCRTSFKVELFDSRDNVFAKGSFTLDDFNIKGCYEEVKYQSVPCQQGSLLIEYIAIPLGVYGRLQVSIYNRKASKKRDFINVNGKIVARLDNTSTYGNYDKQECMLFCKQSDTFEKVEMDQGKMRLSRNWFALPAYSVLVVSVDLCEYETRRTIVNDFIKLLPRPGWLHGDSFIVDDLLIEVGVAWFSPTPLSPLEGNDVYQQFSLRLQDIPTEEIDEMDTDGDDESSSNDESDPSHSSWTEDIVC